MQDKSIKLNWVDNGILIQIRCINHRLIVQLKWWKKKLTNSSGTFFAAIIGEFKNMFFGKSYPKFLFHCFYDHYILVKILVHDKFSNKLAILFRTNNNFAPLKNRCSFHSLFKDIHFILRIMLIKKLHQMILFKIENSLRIIFASNR